MSYGSSGITQKMMLELFIYDPLTGILTNRITRSNRAVAGCAAGSPNANGYLVISVNNNINYVHRLIWLMVYGIYPDHIDHIDRNTSNNSLINLRAVSNADNLRNGSLSTNNTSGVNGVGWVKQNKNWRVRIKINYSEIHLGCFDSLLDAVCCRINANLEYGFHFNHGRKL